MADISAQQVKALREETGLSVMQCKRALEKTNGDMDEARRLLARQAGDLARKKADRALGAGLVASYVHGGGQLGAMVRLSCETDFVAKNTAFADLARDIAMHATAMRPESPAVLLEQPFIKDESRTVGQVIAETMQKFGERIEVQDLVCFSVK